MENVLGVEHCDGRHGGLGRREVGRHRDVVTHGVDGEVGEEEHDGDHEGGGAGEDVLEEPDERVLHLAVGARQDGLQVVAEHLLQREALQLPHDEHHGGEGAAHRLAGGAQAEPPVPPRRLRHLLLPPLLICKFLMLLLV